ncbi:MULTISPECIES: ABC transporter substrate-binding protein [unclassified Microbacterium]|uniref:ABC transporter substrate-binding protein n=1 Tax=unclassified Microbacterium TaxID=2609290 RepID=UPI00301AC9AC
MFTRPWRVTVLAAAAALALTLTGCQSAVQQQEASPSASPVEGGTLQVAQAGDLQPRNVLAARAGNTSWASNVFETLTSYDAQMKPQPLLATDWRVADDSMSIDITLRDDVTFHTGRKMTADDVKFSFEAAADPQYSAQVGYIARSFQSIDVTSATELVVNFTAPTPNIFDFFEQIYILDSETVAGLADGSQVIGTGPFVFESWTPGSEATLVRNDAYWGDKPYLDGIDIAVISDSTAMLNAVRSDRSQIALSMSPVDVKSLSANPSFTIVRTAGGAYPLGVDVTRAPFDKKEPRQALQYAIDRQRIADQVFGDAGIVTDLFWDEATPGYPADLATHYTYDPDKARKMLADSGAAGAAVEVTVIGLPQNTGLAEIVRNNLEEVGLQPTIVVQDAQTWDKNQVAGELGQAFLPVHGLYSLGPATLLNTLPSLREGNPSKFWPEEYVALRKAVTTATADTYDDALHELTAYILDEAFTGVIVQAAGQAVQSTSVHGAEYSSRAYLEAGAAFLAD